MGTTVIYHGDCNDGFAAAWVAWMKLRDHGVYIPANYGDVPPPVGPGDRVYILDFSYPREVLLDLHAKVESLLVLDHHRTAQADLDGLDFCTFDMQKSGAMLAWEHFHPDEDAPPWIVKYVQDRDLWRFDLHGSRAANAAISSWPRDFNYWVRANRFRALKAMEDGIAILRYITQYTDEMCAHARTVEFGGYWVPCVNAPYKGISEICGKLAEDAEFSIGWFQRGDDKYQYSLRSRGEFDVSELARRWGGGGHKNSAGFVRDEQLDL